MEHSSFDEEYVRKLAVGDAEVQRDFVSHFSGLLRIKLRSKLRSPELIEDVRQETFLRVFQSLKKQQGGLQNPERLGAYVNSICNNVMYEALRAATRHSQMPEDLRDILDDHADPARQAVSSERKQIVARVLDGLSAKDRELLRQVYFEERDKTELCREMNVDREYLRVLIHRAKGRFKQALTHLTGMKGAAV
ncbi:MAG: RNA polymerase sigma factor [Bryobacteraceae bacterium]